MKKYIEAALTDRRLPLIAALLGMVLALPFLGIGLQVDDYFQRAVFVQPSGLEELFGAPISSMYAFADGDPERTGRLVDIGIYPWTTDENLRLHFWRPLSALTHGLDFELWPAAPWLMHLHSLLWFGAAILLASLLYRRVHGPTAVAGLAAVLFALDDAHALPAGWLANRSGLVALVLGLLVLLLHDSWRRSGRRSAALAAPVLLLLGLLAKESAVAVCAYLFSYALFLDRGRLLSRALSLVPYTIVVIGWRIYYGWAGYGAGGSESYVDPVSAPLTFARALLERGPILLLGQLALPPSDVFTFTPPRVQSLLLVVAVAVLVPLVALIAPHVRRDRQARFWTVGMLLSVLPASIASPQDRLLLFVGLGGMGLLASFFLAPDVSKQDPGISSWWRRLRFLDRPMRGALLAVHLVLAPLLFVAMMLLFDYASDQVVQLGKQSVQPGVGGEGVTVVLPNVGTYPIGTYLVLTRALDEQPPVRVRSLAPASMVPVPIRIRRLDERTLLVRPDGGYSQSLFRERADLESGAVVSLSGMTIEVVEVNEDGWPLEVAYRFDVPLEDATLIWWRVQGARGEVWSPPAIGESVLLGP